MDDLTVLFELRPPIAHITLNRPAVRNALNGRTLAELLEAVERAAADPRVRVLLLTGAGEKAFAAGADIGELAGLTAEEGQAYSLRGQYVLRRMETLGKPVIACINGYALGGGCELALACTLRLAAESARLGMPEVKLGILAGYGGTQRLARLVGRGAALKLLLTGASIEAGEALRIGLVDEVTPDGGLMERAEALAREIAANAPLAVAETLAAVDEGLDHPLDLGLLREAQRFGQLCGTEDKAEGTRAFLEKRAAEWRGN